MNLLGKISATGLVIVTIAALAGVVYFLFNPQPIRYVHVDGSPYKSSVVEENKW